MSKPKPNQPVWYRHDAPLLWLQAVTAAGDGNAAAVCQKQWQGPLATPVATSIKKGNRLH